MPATSLAAALRSATDDELAALLQLRPDLATPPPADAGVLATRAGTPSSVARACEGLDTFTLAVLEAMLLLDADAAPVPRSAVDKLVGADTATAWQSLHRLALVWGDPDDAQSIARAARDALGPFPAGLGRAVAALDDTDIAAAVAEVTDDERRLLATLAAGPPIGRTRDAAAEVSLEAAGSPVQRLLARGLLIRRDDQTVELPRQLAIHLRGGQVFTPASLTEPPLRTNPHTEHTVDQVAAGEAMELIRHTEALLAFWSATPPPVLKAGGLGVRELRRVMRELAIDEVRAVLLVELVVGAGLVADSNETTAEWVPTVLTDSWQVATPAARWAVLASSWLTLPRLPGLAYAADTPDTSASAADKPPTPLSERLRRPLAPRTRWRILDALAALPAGTGVSSPEDLVAVLAWRAPRRGGRLRDELVRWTLSEASAIGLVALSAMTTAARALHSSAGEAPQDEQRWLATEAMADAMPAPVDHVLVQADLTVVAPGPLEPRLEADVAMVADVESAGHATVYRITEASVRRALDGGRAADELHELFASRSRTPVPQSLTYLIDDVARRHGRLRGGACACFLRCDDEALLAEVLSHPAADELGLRKIAPTVVVSSLPLAEVIDGLRASGFTPSAEGPDGQVIDLRPRGRRLAARTRTARSPAAASTLGEEQIAAVVARVRAGDRAASTRRGAGVRNTAGTGDTSATLALLAAAARDRRAVWIGFVDAYGTAAQRVVTPVSVGGGILDGADNERYPLHRITSAAFVEA
ncbi:MAG: DNA-binding protein [Actinophytocola sp.]|nr:DNA-binding protein [Actinophytocola sp.]